MSTTSSQCKFAAIEGRWHATSSRQAEVPIALPDEAAEADRYAISIPILGSLIGSMSFTAKRDGANRLSGAGSATGGDPILRVRVMVGSGLLMLFLAW